MGIKPIMKKADTGGRTGDYIIVPPCPSASHGLLTDKVSEQGGQSVRLKLKRSISLSADNMSVNANSNAS